MKKTFLLLALILGLTSCTAVKFETSQPSAATPLQEFPEEMQGHFTSDGQDTLKILNNSFHYSNGAEIKIDGSLSSSEAVLKKSEEIFLLNLKGEEGWEVFPIELSPNKITIYSAALNPNTEKIMQNPERASSVRVMRTEEGKIESYLVSPSDQEFKDLLKEKLFSEKLEFKQLK